ncbi:MAG: peptide chain release factor N(5)-glutamine methyltransferase [Patescibacteria group bacterium]
MTIGQLLKQATIKLRTKCIKFPHLEAEILLSSILKKPCEFILSHSEYKLTNLQLTTYNLQLTKRIHGKPIAYIIGEKEFYGLKFFVNKNVLIPRPETELMVDEAMSLITQKDKIAIIDIGTGSGCIVIALAKSIIHYQLRITNYELFATDISASALFIAKKNAKFHCLDKKIKFIKGNLLTPLINNAKFKIQNSKFIILANLPYLTPTQIKNSPSIKYEPKNALNGGLNGLKLYEKLFKQLKKFNELQAKSYQLTANSYILCEFDPRQAILIKKLIKKYLPQAKLQIKKDLSGLNRLAIITFIN